MPEMKKTTATARELAVASSPIPGARSACAKLLMVPPARPAHIGPGTLEAHVLGSLNVAPAHDDALGRLLRPGPERKDHDLAGAPRKLCQQLLHAVGAVNEGDTALG